MRLCGLAVLMALGLLCGCSKGTERNERNEREAAAQPAIKTEVKPSPNAQLPPSPELRTIKPWDATACGEDAYQNEKLQRHPAIMGLAPEPLMSAYGAPSADESFRVGEPPGTFYGAYGKRLSGPKAANDGAPARVLTWTKSACNFSVFFLKQGDAWQAAEAFEWAVGAQF